MKYLVLVADGMGDWPLQELQGKTPLEAANTPYLDKLASKSLTGLARTIPPGFPPGSDVANMAILGYDPTRYHTGRGPIEARASGLETADKDLIWRLNLVSLSEFSPQGRMLDYAAGHPPQEIALKLIDFIKQNLKTSLLIYPGVQYRHLLVEQEGVEKSSAQLNIRPPHDILDQEIEADYESFAAYPLLFEFLEEAHKLLKNNPYWPKANGLWPWGQGPALSLPNFFEKSGLKGAVISAVDLIKGLGRAAGLEVLEVEGATGLVDTNYQGKVEAALNFLDQGDFIFLHLEGPDEAAHSGSLKDKILAIERFDELVLGKLLAGLKEDFALLILCDHLTPLVKRTHVDDPVPFLIYSSKKEWAGVSYFSEHSADRSRLIAGSELLSFFLEQVNA
ncbi:MAG TPA: cofactor-independent phosphoglycerate mutase [Desulfonauticus sp.]|nr:MAG: Putative 2,3-bisphosphoglycerate-independent phosphoglycerate mutase [Desulfonauticus sp. 38_4375]HCO12215.1 cofactor-independent phosphoglycerate mutase [Desulfonauticus sp.]